jgi:hypothetical protein
VNGPPGEKDPQVNGHQPKRKEKIAKLLKAAIDYADNIEESA